MMLLACMIAAPAKTGPEMNTRWDSIQRGSAGPSLPVVRSSYPAFVGKGSGIFFPLRSNAKSLVAGAPAQSVVAGLKLASLLYDRVLVEDGEYRIQGGPGGGSRFWTPPDGEAPRAWQRPSERSREQASNFSLAMKPSTAPADAHAMVVLDSPASVSWRATFEPIKRDLTSGCDWFEFGHADDAQDRGFVLSRRDREVSEDPDVQAVLPEHFVRDLVVKQANRDMLVGAAYGSAVSMDGLHRRILTAQIRNGTAAPAFGPHALTILVPDVRRMTWANIVEIRANRGVRQYRNVLREVEALAWYEASSLDEFENVVHREFERQLIEVVDAKSLPRRLVRAVVNVAVGELTGLMVTRVPGAGGAVGLAVSVVEETREWSARRWVGAHQGISRRAKPRS